MTSADLFGEPAWPTLRDEPLCDGAVVLRGFALARQEPLLRAIAAIVAQAPFRHLLTPGGRRMSVAMTNAGPLGWVSDRRGYRYDPLDPLSGRPWPVLPAVLRELAASAAARAGFEGFAPDACLVNRYQTGTRLSLHQDRDEADLGQPIVSVSLGVPAVFLFGGLQRDGPTQRVPLAHGDVVVWGGPARLRFHGVLPLKPAQHPRLGSDRINLTFRRAGPSRHAEDEAAATACR
ncbi:MAG: DNA oxidative demethylase AlkB [Pseudomonadota bacterium]|jgi:alkylated DNA repair protein (DNA oxidative demethylase)|nr:DNA oxidative demethylase AlkB [Xanthomonadaceae bacterium]MDE2247564.1 DNA oxidative demethylase AlkB [Xanthomonadaceae bacterium]MDE3210208.1 DNA oxidative demethylase AlkB [Pseudomonadota bacterium]